MGCGGLCGVSSKVACSDCAADDYARRTCNPFCAFPPVGANPTDGSDMEDYGATLAAGGTIDKTSGLGAAGGATGGAGGFGQYAGSVNAAIGALGAFGAAAEQADVARARLAAQQAAVASGADAATIAAIGGAPPTMSNQRIGSAPGDTGLATLNNLQPSGLSSVPTWVWIGGGLVAVEVLTGAISKMFRGRR